MRCHIRPRLERFVFPLAVMLAAASVAICTSLPCVGDASAEPYSAVPKLEGRFTIAGSNTMFPLMTRLTAAFKRYYPTVVIGVEGQGSKSVSTEDGGAGAFWEMVQNKSVYRRGDGGDVGHHVSMQVHVMASSRKLSEEELTQFSSRYGYNPMEVPVAMDAVVLYANASNPVLGLTLAEVDAIFSRSRHRGHPQEIQTWGVLVAEPSWKDATIHLYGRNDKSGTNQFFREQALANGQFASSLTELPGTASVIETVSKDSHAIGYSGLGLQHSQVRIVPVAEAAGMPYIMPSAETVMNKTYPLWRTLYLYVNHKPGTEMPAAIQEFLRFMRSQEGQAVVKNAGFFPLHGAQMQESR